jgi:hypothetical protein
MKATLSVAYSDVYMECERNISHLERRLTVQSWKEEFLHSDIFSYWMQRLFVDLHDIGSMDYFAAQVITGIDMIKTSATLYIGHYYTPMGMGLTDDTRLKG